MKPYFYLFFFVLFACENNAKKPVAPLPVAVHVATDGEEFIEGKLNRQNLLTSPLTTWFEEEYNSFYVAPEWIEEHQGLLEGLQLKLFLGSWCEDSEREVPGMFKLLDAIGLQEEQLEMYAMNKDKVTAENFEKDLNIFNIPTLIFYKNDKEINRIVELTVVSLADDISKILKGQAYEHAYYGF